MAVRIQMRRDSSANWTLNNPLLAEGEMGLELDSGRWKIGNGTSLWSALVYSNQIYSGSSVISDSSANTALRITQTGTGNALLVEDSTNVDNSPFIIDANGNVGIGTLSLPNKLNVDGTVSVTNINTGYNTTVTSGGTLTLTNASTNQQFFTGTNNHTLVLPVVSTLSLGTNYKIHNNSAGTITINSSGGNLVYILPPQVTAQLTCILVTGTTAASWDVDTTLPDGYTTTVTAAGTTTLTVASSVQQFFTGTLNQTLVMPVASTMNIGAYYVINNNSTGTITIKTSALTDIVTLPANMTVNITCILNSGITPASWDVDYSGFTYITGTGSAVMSTGSTLANATITGQLTSTLASGTAPLIVASNTLVSNLNAQYLNGNASSFFAPINSPSFTGNPVAITPAVDNNSTQLATTAFVVGQASATNPNMNGTVAIGTSLRYARADHIHASDTSRASLTGAVFTGNISAPNVIAGYSTTITSAVAITLTATSNKIQLFTGSSNQTLILPVVSTLTLGHSFEIHNNSNGVITIQSSGANTIITLAVGMTVSITCISLVGTGVTSWDVDYTGASFITGTESLVFSASPTLTGTPLSTTAAVDTNTTQIATTAYVIGQGYLKSSSASGTYAPLASPAFTGVPTAPTAAVDTNTTQVATTAFVLAQASGANPLALGSVGQGTSTRYSRQDHVHPTTGLGLTSGTLAQFAATTSAQLAGVISDETGSGSLVFSASPTLTGNTVITDNGANPALRITQTGTGAAFLVEDSASTDATPFVIDANGSVGIGTSSPANSLVVYGSNGVIDVNRFVSNTATGPTLITRKSASATVGTHASMSNGETVGRLIFQGSDGTSFVDTASIIAAVDATPGTNDMPGRLTFSTTADGASSTTERMRITSAGNVGIGTSSPEAPLHVQSAGSVAGENGILISNPSTLAYSTTRINMRSAGVDRVVISGQRDNTTLGGTFVVSVSDSTGAAPERMRIDSAGNIGIGVTVPTAKLTIAASTTSTASLNLAHGTAPTAPTNGDVWTTTTGMYVRVNSTTVGPLGAGGGGGGSAVYYQDNAPTSPTTGTVWVESDAITSVINSNDYVLKTSIYNESVSPIFLMGA